MSSVTSDMFIFKEFKNEPIISLIVWISKVCYQSVGRMSMYEKFTLFVKNTNFLVDYKKWDPECTCFL